MFHYKLETLLSFRKKVEEVLQRELGEKKRTLFIQNDALRKIDDDYKNQQKNLSGLSKEKTINPVEIERYYSYFDSLEFRLIEQKKKIEEVKKEVAVKREKLIAALKKRKTLEHLKKKKYKMYVGEIKKKEQKVIDEVVLCRFKKDG